MFAEQLPLLEFADDAHRAERRAAQLRRLPATVRLGVYGWSSWVQGSEAWVLSHGLAQVLADPRVRSVCLTPPRELWGESLWRVLAAQIPAQRRVVVEAHRSVTHPQLTRSAFGVDHVRVNPHFLDAHHFSTDVWLPASSTLNERLDHLALIFPAGLEHAGVSPEGFTGRLERFLQQIPEHTPIATEVREPGLLTDAYAALLARFGVTPILSAAPDMPSLAEQALRLPVGRELLIRLDDPLGPPYASALARRAQIVGLLRAQATPRALILVGDGAEGDGSHTLDRLLEEITESCEMHST